jgi:hypothetical protein
VGISLLWRYTPPEIRIANPEVTVRQDGPFTVQQDRPFIIQPPAPLKVEMPQLPINPGFPFPPSGNNPGPGNQSKTPAGDVIKREVTVFSMVEHGAGTIVSGWSYLDGRGGVPVNEFCYYSAPSFDGSHKRVNVGQDRAPSTVGIGLVPDFNLAFSKCQWSEKGRLTLAE